MLVLVHVAASRVSKGVIKIQEGTEKPTETRRAKAYNCEGHNKRPKGSHGIRSNGLEHRHIMLCILSFDGIRLVIGDLCILIEFVVRLLVVIMVHLFVNVVIANIIYLKLLLNRWSVSMRLGFRHIGLDGVAHVELAFACYFGMNSIYTREVVL